MMLGGTDVIICSTPEVVATPRAKSIRTLAVMAPNRIARFGNVPTLQQATGTNHSAAFWRGLVAPKGLDASAATALTVAAKKAWDSADLQAVMQRRGFVSNWRAGGAFTQFMETADAKMGATVKAAGLA